MQGATFAARQRARVTAGFSEWRSGRFAHKAKTMDARGEGYRVPFWARVIR